MAGKAKQDADGDESDGMGGAPPIDMMTSGEMAKLHIDKIDAQARGLGAMDLRMEQYEKTINELNGKVLAAEAAQQNADAELAVAIRAAERALYEKERATADLAASVRQYGEAMRTINAHETTLGSLRQSMDEARKTIDQLRVSLDESRKIIGELRKQS